MPWLGSKAGMVSGRFEEERGSERKGKVEKDRKKGIMWLQNAKLTRVGLHHASTRWVGRVKEED